MSSSACSEKRISDVAIAHPGLPKNPDFSVAARDDRWHGKKKSGF
jgi:hypothetical protein